MTFLLIVGMLFEMIGIGALLPVLTVVLKPKLILENETLSDFIQFLKIESEQDLTFILLGFVIFIYVFKSVFLLWTNKKQNILNAQLIEWLSNHFYKTYLHKSYLYHVNKNSSEIIKLFQVEINHFNTFLIALIYLITETSLIIAVVTSLLLIEPLSVLSIFGVFLISSSVFYRFTKKYSQKWGQIRENKDKKMSKLLLESYGGIKEIIKTNSFGYFNNTFEEINKTRAAIFAKNQTLSQIPRYYLEIITIAAIVVFISINLIQSKTIESIIVTLGVFVAAILRILPSVNRILTSLQQIKYYQSSVEVIYSELSENNEAIQNETQINKIPFDHNIELKNITFCYPNNGKIILTDINLFIEKGSFVGFLGESGSGKSTLINIIAGLLEPNTGNIYIDGNRIPDVSKMNWRSNIGYVSQSTFLLDASVMENVAFGVKKQNISKERVKLALKDASLLKFIEELSEGLNTTVGERGIQFSGGQQQRLGIARALYHSPDILILDEATSALDKNTESEIMKSIYTISKGTTVLMITHRLSTIKNCTHKYIVKNGRIENYIE